MAGRVASDGCGSNDILLLADRRYRFWYITSMNLSAVALTI
jgi:hypothetical protein